MKTKIVSNAEIKVLLGISGSSQDALVELWNGISTDAICEIFGVDQLASHAIVNERVKLCDSTKMYLSAFPVDASSITIKDILEKAISEYTFYLDPGKRRTVRFKTASGVPTNIGYETLLVSYTAGYTTQDTAQVVDFASLVGTTIRVKVAGVTTVWTFVAAGATGNQINAATSNDVTATNIATALSGTASTNTVTLPLGTTIELGTALAADLAIVNSDVPDSLKMAIALMVGGGIVAKSQSGGVSGYQVGSKRINFRDDSDKDAFISIINKWSAFYKRAKIVA